MNSAHLSQIWELESLQIYTILKQESNSSPIEDNPQNSTWKVCVGMLKGDESSGYAQSVDRSPQICWCSHREPVLERRKPCTKENNEPSGYRIYICGDLKTNLCLKQYKARNKQPKVTYQTLVHVGLHKNMSMCK